MFLLGRFEVRAGDDVIIDQAWHHRNAKALLKLLAVQRDRALPPKTSPVGWQNSIRICGAHTSNRHNAR